MKTRISLVAALMIGGCGLPASNPAADALARKAYTQLIQADDGQLEAEFEPRWRGPRAHEMFVKMRAYAPTGAIPKPRLVKIDSYAGTGGSTLTLVHEYDYADLRIVASVVLVKDAKATNGWIIRAIKLNRAPVSELKPQIPEPSEMPPARTSKPSSKRQQT